MSAKSRQIQKIILEEIESIERGDDLIVQDDIEEQELGGGYSVEFGTMPEFHEISERRLRKIISSELERQALSEGMFADTASNVFQSLVGTAIEALPALAAGIPTAGTGAAPGAAAGMTVQTVIDCALAIKPISDAVTVVQAFATKASSTYDLFKDIVKIGTDFSKNPDGLYNHVKKIIAKSVKTFGDSWITKLKQTIEQTISKIKDSIVKSIHAIIPEAATAGAVAQIMIMVLNQLDENCFDVLKGIASKLGKFGSFIFNPSESKAFFEKAIPATVNLLNSIKEKINDTSYATVATVAGAASAGTLIPVALLTRAGGPAALEKMSKLIDDNKSTIIDVVHKITSVLIPAFVGMVATVQSITREDWKEKKEDKDKKDVEEKPESELPVASYPAPAPSQENLAEIRKQIYQIDKSLGLLKSRI